MINVIHIVGSLAPEYGGPARSVPQLCLELANLDCKVTLLSTDLGRMFSKALVPQHKNLSTIIIPAKFRLGLKPILVPGLMKTLRDVVSDNSNILIHDHGIWLPQNGLSVRIATAYDIPLVITPRGMLEPWALSYRRWRKKIAWYLFQKNRLIQANLIHATSQVEAENIINLGLEKPVIVIPNGTEIPGEYPSRAFMNPEKKKILFISRIHPKKGLLNLVEAWRTLNPPDWELVIAGYDEINHQWEVEQAVKLAGLEDTVSFIGPVEDDQKWEVYQNSDVFILPTFSENFGIVVAEALASGLPVITTTGTPWEDLEKYDCGWWVEPTVSGLVSAMRDAFSLSAEQRQKMGLRGKKLVQHKYSWNSVARQMKEVYQRILAGERLPVGSPIMVESMQKEDVFEGN